MPEVELWLFLTFLACQMVLATDRGFDYETQHECMIGFSPVVL